MVSLTNSFDLVINSNRLIKGDNIEDINDIFYQRMKQSQASLAYPFQR